MVSWKQVFRTDPFKVTPVLVVICILCPCVSKPATVWVRSCRTLGSFALPSPPWWAWLWLLENPGHHKSFFPVLFVTTTRKETDTHPKPACHMPPPTYKKKQGSLLEIEHFLVRPRSWREGFVLVIGIILFCSEITMSWHVALLWHLWNQETSEVSWHLKNWIYEVGMFQ